MHELQAEAERERRRRCPAIIFMDGRIFHRGREITREELEEICANSQGIRAVNFQAPPEHVRKQERRQGYTPNRS